MENVSPNVKCCVSHIIYMKDLAINNNVYSQNSDTVSSPN